MEVNKTIEALELGQRKVAIDLFNILSKGDRIKVLKHVAKQIYAGAYPHDFFITYLLLLKKIYQPPKQ